MPQPQPQGLFILDQWRVDAQKKENKWCSNCLLNQTEGQHSQKNCNLPKTYAKKTAGMVWKRLKTIVRSQGRDWSKLKVFKIITNKYGAMIIKKN